MSRKIPEQALRSVCSRIDGECGLYVSVPESGEALAIDADRVFRAASTIKVPVLALLLRDAEQGLVALDAKRRVKPENRVVGSGILQSLSPELELTLFDLAELMIVLSDNTATNEVIDTVGIDRVNQFCAQNGFAHTAIGRKMMMGKGGPAPSASGELPVNRTSAGDLGRLLERAAAGTLIGPQASRTLIRIMAGQRLPRLATRLPTVERNNPHVELALPPEGRVVAACKSGTLSDDGIAHDSGVFYLPDGRRYVMAMLTRTKNTAAASALIAEAALVMYEAMA